MRPGSQAPLLISVAGVSPRAGTTTTTVALAHAWPGPESALIVEADPAGGQLAQMVGADPHLGLASLARRTIRGEPITPQLLAQHVQRLPGGETFLAAPPLYDPARTVPGAALLTDPRADWRAFGSTVFADCGVPEPDLPAHPVVAAADATLFVVRADHIDPEIAAQRILDLTRRRRPRGIVVIGGSRAYRAAIGFPVVCILPDLRGGAQALLLGRRARRHLITPARQTTNSIEIQLRTEGHRERLTQPHTRRTARQERPSRRDDSGPRIYSIDTPPAPTPRLRTSEPVIVEAARPLSPPPASGPVLVGEAEDAGQPGEGDLAAAPESDLHPEADIADTAPAPAPTQAGPALTVRVFGPTRVFWHAPGTAASVEITTKLQPRSRELITVLALHPDGLTRSQLTELLWGERPIERATGVLTNTLSRLRTTLGAASGGQIAELLAEDRAHYRLSATAVSVDYWDFNTAILARRRASDDTDRIAACRAITAIATTDLAPELTDAWAEPVREAARRDTHNALQWLATHDVDHDPRATLELLETTAQTDPHNEVLWRDILRQHARLGEYASLARAYALLTRKLAEIGETPSPETRQLLESLRRGESSTPPRP